MQRKIVLGFCSIILILSLVFFSLNNVQASPDEVTNSPSAYDLSGDFINADWAYTSDNFWATYGVIETWGEQTWWNYGFELEGNTIDEVYVYSEHKSSVYPNDTCEVRLSRDGGSSWGDWVDVPVEPVEATYEVNMTDYFDWVGSDFSDDNFRVSMRVYVYASGCYHPESEVSLWENKVSNFDMSVKKISDVKKGDVLLGYNETSGEYIPNVMLSDAIILKGDFVFYRFIAEFPMGLWDKEVFAWDDAKEVGRKDICVTSEQRLFTVEKGLISAGDVKVGMSFYGLFRQKGVLVSMPVEIVEIEVLKGNLAVTLDGTSEHIFSHYLYAKTGKTYSLDWLPVKVVYSEAEEWVDCQHIGVNNTLAGEPTLFSSDWTDINASEGLSHFLFSTNRSTVWVNGTWSNAWRNTVWADAEGTLNNSEYIEAFRFYINNTAGIEYASTICYFPTSINPELFDSTYYLLGGISFLPFSLLIAFLLRRKQDADRL